jgi:hypothetical protein
MRYRRCLERTLSFLLSLPSLGSSVAFSGATSIATIRLYTYYGWSPVTLRLVASTVLIITFKAISIALCIIYRHKFKRRPFHLGAFSHLIALVAMTWILFSWIVFILPELNPVNW